MCALLSKQLINKEFNCRHELVIVKTIQYRNYLSPPLPIVHPSSQYNVVSTLKMSNDDGDSFVEATVIDERYLYNDLSNMHTIPVCVTTPNATASTSTTIVTATSVATTPEVR